MIRARILAMVFLTMSPAPAWPQAQGSAGGPRSGFEQEFERMDDADKAGNLSEAAYHGKRALELIGGDVDKGSLRHVAVAHLKLGDILERMNTGKNAKEALVHFRLAYQLAGEAQPPALSLRSAAASRFAELANEAGNGADPEALEMANEALRIDRAANKAEASLADLKNLALVYIARDDYRNALGCQQEYVDGAAKIVGPQDVRLLGPLNTLAGLHWVMQDFARALSVLDRAESILAAHPDAEFKIAIKLRKSRAQALLGLSQPEQAAASLDKIVAAYAAHSGQIPAADRDELAGAYMLLGDIQFGRKDWSSADRSYRSWLEERIVSGNLDDSSIPLALFKLGQVAGYKGDAASQLRLYRRSMQLLADDTGPEELVRMRPLLESMMHEAGPVLARNNAVDAQKYLDRIRAVWRGEERTR